MTHKSLAQLEIGSPEWIAKRQALVGTRTIPSPDAPPSALALGALALVASAIVLAALRVSAMMMRRS